MIRRHEGLVTAALATVAAVAIGCGGDTAKPVTSKLQPAPVAVPTTFVDDGKTKDVTTVAVGPARFADGEEAFAAKNYTEATRIFTSYTSENPKKAWGHYMLGISSWKAGDAAMAEKAFEEALAIDPKHVKSLLNLSRVLLDHGRASDAVVKLVAASELQPDSGEISRLLGRALYASGQVDESIASYRKAIELDEHDSWAMNNLGLIFLEQGRPNDALPLFSRAVELKGDVAIFQNNLGMALEHAGRFEDARSAYGNALAADQGYAKAQKNLARIEKVKEPVKEVAQEVSRTDVPVAESGVEPAVPAEASVSR